MIVCADMIYQLSRTANLQETGMDFTPGASAGSRIRTGELLREQILRQYLHMADITLNRPVNDASKSMAPNESGRNNYLELDRLKGLDPVNRTYLEQYIHDNELRQLRDRSIKLKLWRDENSW
jgi:hypothetical protein